MDAAGPAYSKKIISTIAPCYFVDETRKLFDEIREKKDQFEKDFDWDVGTGRTAEYYDLVDSSVRDRDALDLLQLKRHLQNELNAVHKENRKVVKNKFAKQFTQDIDVTSSDLSKTKMEDTKTTINVKTRIFAKPKVGSTQPHYMLPTRNTFKNVPNEKEFCQSQCKQNGRNTQPFPKMQEMKDLNSTHIIRNQNEDSVMLSQKLSEKIQAMFKHKKQSRMDNNCTPERDKYFPCAIPLGPPNRRKVEVIIDHIDEETNDIPSVIELPPAVTIDTVCSISEKPVSRKTLIAPAVRTSKIKTVHSIPEMPLSQNKLTIETLPSINIIGKAKPTVTVNSKLFCFQAEDASTKNESPEILERQISPDIRGCDVPSPRIRHSEQRFTTTQLSGILNAVNRCRTEMHAERTQLDRKQIENLVIEIVEQNMQKDNVFRTKEISFQKEVNKKVNIETQTTEQVNKTATVATQTKCNPAINKAQQTTCVIPLNNVVTQTEVQGDIDKKVVIVRLECHDLSSHQCCNIPCENSSDIPSELKNARTSTPIDSELQALVFKKSQGTNTMELCKESDVADVSAAKRNSRIETKDACTSAIFDRECQTLPETKDATAQYEIPEIMVCRSTMTTELNKREVSVQSQQIESNVADISDIPSGIDMKSVAIQSEFLDLSLSSTTTVSTVTSDNEFVDDFLSEGEIHLPWNLRLLSLLERGIIPRSVPPSLNSSGATSKGTDEPSLSEGEIHPKYLPAWIQNVNKSRSQSVTSNSPALLLYSSDSSIMEPVPQKPSDRHHFSDSQTGSLRSDFSEGQIPNPSILRSDSALSSEALASGGDDISISDSEFVTSKKMYIVKNDMSSKPFQDEANAPSASISRNLPSLPSTSLPEANYSILDSSKFHSFLHTTSELNPSGSQDSEDLKYPVKFTNPCLEKYLSDRVPQAPCISKSPDLKTVTEEDFDGSKDGTESGGFKDNQPSSENSSTKPEDNDESFYSTDSSQNVN